MEFFDDVFVNTVNVGLYLDNGITGNGFWNNKFNNWHNVFFASGVGANAWISPGADAIDQPE